jgi:hypothetical protein
MRRKPRGTLQVNSDVKGLFMLAKPMDMSSSDFLKGLLTSHAKEIREAHERTQKYTGLAALTALGKKEPLRPNCLGRPEGAKDIQPRKRRTKRELAREKQQELKSM